MKIIFIIPSLRRGGVERVTTNIINSLSEDVYDIKLITCKGDEKYNEMVELLNNNVEVIYLNKNNVRNALFNLFIELNREKPNIVFTSFDHLSLPVLLFKLGGGKSFKTVVRLNTLPSNMLISNWRGKIYSWFFNKVINLSDIIIAQSNEMKQDIINYYGVNNDKVISIRNIVDIKNIEISSKENIGTEYFSSENYTYIAVGSLGSVKGFDLLIRAVDIIVKQGHKNIQLLIMGDNRESNEDYRSYLIKLIEELELESYVHLIGFKSNPYAFIGKADTFVLSSRKEGFPNVVLESLVLRKPCLVTNCVDFEGVIHEGVNGVIVPSENVEKLAEGLLKVKEIKQIPENTFSNFDYNKWFLQLIK